LKNDKNSITFVPSCDKKKSNSEKYFQVQKQFYDS